MFDSNTKHLSIAFNDIVVKDYFKYIIYYYFKDYYIFHECYFKELLLFYDSQ